jgi:hypothetical protein
MRIVVAAALSLLAACASPPGETAKADPTKEAGYEQTLQRLIALNHEAKNNFSSGKKEEAGKLVVDGEALASRLLAVPEPTVAAAEAASDVDDLYGRMLLSNRHYGDARLLFQKNLSRWRHWQPPTAETARRLQQAVAAIAECDRHIVE